MEEALIAGQWDGNGRGVSAELGEGQGREQKTSQREQILWTQEQKSQILFIRYIFSLISFVNAF